MSSSSGDGDTSSQTSATLSETHSQLMMVDEFDSADRPPPRRLLVRSTQRSSSSSSDTDTASVSSGEEEFKRQEEWNLLFQRILAPEREDSDGDETSEDSDSADSPRMRGSVDSTGIAGGSINARRSIMDASGASKRRMSFTSPSSSPLFVLASEGSAIEDLTAQLREFLKHYNPRMPLDPENASALAEGFAETLRQVLTPQQYENATNVINSCCGQWIHSLFRLPAATRPVFVDSAWDGRLAIAKAAMQRAWPDYPQQGFRAFGDCIPTIYSSFQEPFLEQLRCQLGLPAESIRAGEDVVAMIEADLLENVSAPFEKRKLTPFLVFGHVGDIYDRFDDISRLQALCKNENIWLHIEGESIVLLCQKHPPHDLLPITHADSILLDAVDICPGENINSVVVFYRRDAAAWAMVEKLGVATKRMQLVLWLQMQMLGKDNILNGIGRARHLVHLMLNRVDEVPYIELLAPRHPAQVQIAIRYLPSPDDSSDTYVKDAFEEEDLPVDVEADGDADDEADEEEEEEGETEAEMAEEGDDGSPTSPTSSRLKEASSAIPRPASSTSLSNPSNNTIPSSQPKSATSAKAAAKESEWTTLSPAPQARRRSDAEIAFEQALPYLNQINQQVLRDVISTIDSEDPNHAISLEVSIISVNEPDSSLGGGSGSSKSFMRFAPLTSRALWQLSDAQVHAFCDGLLIETKLINSCIFSRQAFRRACEKLAPGAIVFVQTRPPSLIGLGAVRYRPKLVADLATVAGPGSHEGERIGDLIDELNEKIFLRLKRNKAFGLLFAEARSQDGSHRCISVQLDATPFTAKRAEQVAKLVVRVAQRVEDKIKFSERIGEIVAASVRVAQQKLKQESDRVRQEEGIIRKLPIVGSVLNWWSPVERNIRGQTFDLLSTSLEVHEKPPARAPQPAPAATTSTPTAKKVFLASPSHPGLIQKPSSVPGSKSVSKEMPADLIESSSDNDDEDEDVSEDDYAESRSESGSGSSAEEAEEDDDDVEDVRRSK